jgi:serine/threonine protein kinase
VADRTRGIPYDFREMDEMSSQGSGQRWQGPKSDYPWEQQALDFIRGKMPDAEPYRAWQTFTFTAGTGHVREVDLFIATPGGLFLVEIKSHPGNARNNGSTWLLKDDSKVRTIENPLHFTDLKAKELKGQLDWAAKQLNVKERIPRIEAVVFLSAENLRCEFDDTQRQRVFGRDDRTGQTGLPGIWADFLNQPPASERNRVTPTLSKQLGKLLHKAGIARLHRIGRVGPYELDPKSFDAGPTWEDYLANNPSLPTDQPRRVRVYLTQRSATDDERRSIQRAAHREYLALQGISHDGIVRAEQYSDELLPGPAVVFRHGKDWQRLDHFMATHESLELETRLEMVRQLAEALDHAHRRHLYHRALAARCIYVELDGRYPRLKIADWQVAARPHGTSTTSTTSTGTAPGSGGSGPVSLVRHIERSAGPYLAPEFATREAPPALLDVFGLGALSYLILTGNPPADTREQLAAQLAAEHALVPSSVTDSISPTMDALVREATAIYPGERTESVRKFLKDLDRIEEEITAPDADTPEPDPLTAGKGDEIAGWTVERALGKGSTSRALLVTKDGGQRVFKVALTDTAARRLEREAQQLGQLTDSHVVRLLDPPFDAGPPDHRRTVIGVEYLQGDTLADELRRHGPLTIHELERLGEDLFQALKFLDGRGVWHRDIKPDNLALRPLQRKGRELVLFDFSLAGIPDTELGVGTTDYLDPFLGTGRRDRYDQAAELYAVAVTLHEMASGELPSWGDDLVPSSFLGQDEQAQLAEDIFDPVLRDGLVEFFRTAFHRDANKRFGSLHQMTRAWTDIFADLETIPPLTTASTVDTVGQAAQGESATTEQIRSEAAAKATATTTLAAAGLSPYALSIAQQRLGISTAGELARVPARRITRLRGIGSVPRYELVRRSREWRQRFNLPEAELSYAGPLGAQIKPQDQHRDSERVVASLQPRTASPQTAQPSEPEPSEPADLAHLSVDDLVRKLIPDSPELALVVGLAGVHGGVPVSPWADRQEIARATGMPETEVTANTDRLRARWAKSVPALLPVRDEIVEILREHGGIMGGRGLAAALLARRGSELGDPAERLRVAAICVRAAIDTEERRDKARLARCRSASGAAGTGDAGKIANVVLVALTQAASDEGTPAPRPEDLFAYAELLGDQADLLAARDPLPGVTEIKQALRDVMIKLTLGDVDTPGHLPWLSDTDLVLLAAAASAKTAATARLELYPRDLSPERALKISQAGSFLGGASDAELARRVLARFPDLATPPRPEDIARLLTESYDAMRGTDGLLRLRSSSQLSGSRGSVWSARTGPAARDVGVEAAQHTRQRLDEARRRGGFVTLKVGISGAAPVIDRLTRLDGVTGVNVTQEFITLLRGIVEKQGKPRWHTVLSADDDSASPAAKNGFARLLTATWERLESHIHAAAPTGIVLLHDATPLARYTGGAELLAKLANAARQSGEAPHGLWLLCPMQNPMDPPRLDAMTVGVIPGDAEQVVLVHEDRSKGAA